eukprot:8615671-Pyramimonas_sp.AAC.1
MTCFFQIALVYALRITLLPTCVTDGFRVIPRAAADACPDSDPLRTRSATHSVGEHSGATSFPGVSENFRKP